MSRRVVITGLGTVNPLGNNVETTWDNVKKGVCGIDEITRIDTTNHAVKLAGEVKNLDVTAVIDKKDARRMDRYAQYAVVAADEAFKQSGLDMEKEDAERCGVIFSSGIGGMEVTEKNYQTGERRGFDKISPFYIPMTIANMGAGHIAISFGFKGICTCVVTACASGGFVMGEGAGALVLEEYEHAKARGAEILGEVVGYGATCDAYHITAPCPDGAGGAACMAMAVKDAGIKPEQVGYINAHGTSTHLNDAGETMAIKTTFGEHAYKLMVSSTKSMTGHLLGGSGAVEAVITALALHDGFIPATINYQVPDEECDLDIVPNEGRNVQVEYALSNSLGFGGHNASILLKKFEA